MSEKATSRTGKDHHKTWCDLRPARLLPSYPTVLCHGLSIDGTGYVSVEHFLGIWQHKISQECKLLYDR